MTDFQESIRIARRTDLADYLVTNHPTEVVVTGHSVYLKAHSSIYTKFGYCGYTRFSSMETGNSIDCLVRYLNYSFRDAVNELASKGRSIPIKNPASLSTVGKSFEIPKSAQWPYNRVYAYLRQRGIPDEMIRRLFQENLLYQEAITSNAVFISRDRRFCELRGTNTFAAHAFHGIRRLHPSCFWSVRNNSLPVETAYICEGAIDAVSLLALHIHNGINDPAAYVSIGGVRNQQAIDRIAASVHTVIAVDNDQAGQECRSRNSALEYIVPVHKDWNEDLQHLTK